jgi:hypothetical protein
VAALEAARAGAVSAKAGAVLSNFVSPVDGMLKVHYVKAERQGSTLDASAVLQAEIQRAGGPESHSDPVLHRFPSPLQSSNADCTDDWNLYGGGPFTYTAPSQPGNVSDAWVFSLSCSSAYAQQSGVCETTNQGSGPGLIVLAWTFLGDEAFERSILRFDLAGLPPVVDSIAGATLRLTPWNEPPAGDNAFHVSKVSQAWSETAVTWLNQPAVTTPTITVPSGSAPVSASVTPIVQDWITNPSTNYGFGLRLVTEQYYRRYYFASSDNTDSSLRPGLTIDFSNPAGEPLAEYVIAPVSPGEETTLYYRIDGVPVSPTTQTATTMTIGGVEYEGELLGFETGSSCPSGVGYHDRLEVFAYVDTLTTVVLEFDRDPATYLPMKGDSIRVTARVHPEPPQGSEVVFRLAGVDSLRFRDTELDSLVVPVVGDSASAKLWSYAYWGVASLTATHRGLEGEASDAGEIPIDADDDGIADSWEMSPEGGGAMNLGGSYQDQDWDEEASPGTTHDGDDFTKFDEYKGYMLRLLSNPQLGSHFRMKTSRKEFFISSDTALQSETFSAITSISQQLDMEPIYFDRMTVSPYSYGKQDGDVLRASVRIVAADTASVSGNGIRWDYGQELPHNLVSGGTAGSMGCTDSTSSTIYLGAINNFWNENTFPEAADTSLTWLTPDLADDVFWYAVFASRNIDDNPGTNDFVNPLDLLNRHPEHGPLKFSNNDPYDSIIAEHNEADFTRIVVLHELGHALGIVDHPYGNPTVMREGVGPGKIDEFMPNDIALMRLKYTGDPQCAD